MASAPQNQDTRTTAANENGPSSHAPPSPSPPTAPYRPRLTEFTVAGRTHRFFLATAEAEQWYAPPKAVAMLEYEWLAANVDLRDQVVLDVGSHHGHYALVLAAGGPRELICVDAVESNCAVTTVNLALNGIRADVRHLAVSTTDGVVEFTDDTNGRVVERGVHRVPSARLPTIAPHATVVKLDIEGEEFKVLPDQLDAMAGVHTWVIEIHPWKTRDPLKLMPRLTERFDVHWVNRASLRVEFYPADADWGSHATVFCRRR